jgi:hypothetical protein
MQMDRQHEAFWKSVSQGTMVPAEGFEPPTYGLQNRCTTTVLSRHFKDTASGRMTVHSTAAASGAINRLRFSVIYGQIFAACCSLCTTLWPSRSTAA